MAYRLFSAVFVALAFVMGWLHVMEAVCQERVNSTARRAPYFLFDAESAAPGSPLPQPPFFPNPWKEPGAEHPKRGRVVADPTAPQGKRVFVWDVREPRTRELYHEVKFDRPPEAVPKDYFYAFFVRIDRKNGRDVWHAGDEEKDSFDKAFEVVGDGVRWVVHLGNHGVPTPEHRFSCYLSNSTYHLNPKLEENDGFYPNHGGFSRRRPPELKYETWHALVFKMRWATDDTGEIGLWVDGRKTLEHKGIKTAKAPGTLERLQLWGTIAQPAYDAPPHVRKVDALLFTDDWRDIEAGGYLKLATEAR